MATPTTPNLDHPPPTDFDVLTVGAGNLRYRRWVLPGGRVIRPQFWPEDLDYAGKHVVVIDSGATAVRTILPAMAGLRRT